jgi:hypothetical protein
MNDDANDTAKVDDRLAVRLGAELAQLVDREIDRRRHQHPGQRCGRGDIAREALFRLLGSPAQAVAP